MSFDARPTDNPSGDIPSVSDEPPGLAGAGRMIMTLFLASLGMGFGAILTFYLIMYSRSEAWPPADTPPLPGALWLSTLIIVLGSLAMHRALRSIRRDALRPGAWWLVVTLVFALAFLANQTMNWFVLVAANMPPSLNMYAACFYVLTGLHALHIVGGLVPLSVITARAFRGAYTGESHRSVAFCAAYWHFLDAIWLVMFVVLLITG